jgi:hypothetical protein
LKGESQAVKAFDAACYTLEAPFSYPDQILLNCSDGAYLVNPELQEERFSDPIFLISDAPDQTKTLTLLRQNEIALLDLGGKTNRTELILPSSAFQVLWLPDSSGFLYRTMASLRYYDLTENEDQWLLDISDIYDYTNFNAAWINLTP